MERILFVLTTTCLFLSLLISCKEKEEPIIPTRLEVDKSAISVEASTSKQSFVVFSNKDWIISTEASWLTFSHSSGKADSRITVEVTISANPETEVRSAVVTVKAEDKTVQIEVFQSGKEIIVVIDGIEIPDEKFKQYLVENFDLNGDGVISAEEAEAVTRMDCSGKEIESLEGLEYFVNLDTLICNDNLLTAMDISKNLKLIALNCSSNNLGTLDLSEISVLATLDCSNNGLTGLDLSNNIALTALNCSGNQLTDLDVGMNFELSTLNCSGNQLTELDISKNLELTTLNCSGNQLTILDVSNNSKLEKLDCLDNALLDQILLAEGQIIPELNYDSENTELVYPYTPPEKEYVIIPDAHFKAYLVAQFDTDHDGEISTEEALMITDIRSNGLDIFSMTGIESFPNLEVLYCVDNKLTQVNVSQNLKLKELFLTANKISNLELKANTELLQLNCADNSLIELDISGNVKLERLSCQQNNLKTLDLRMNSALNTLNCRNNANLTTVIIEQGQHIQYIYMDTPPTSLVYATYIEIKDEAFLAYLLENFDTDHDQRISEMEIKAITEMDCSNLDIEFLDGLSLFSNLTSLTCSGNKITSLNLNALTKLVTLICDNNQLSQLNISQNTALVTLDCSHNALVTINTGTNKELVTFICNDNKLIGFEFSANTKLEVLLCQNNSLSGWIDFRYNILLHTLNCQNNPHLLQIFVRTGLTIENLLLDENVTIRQVGEEVGGIKIPDSKFREYIMENFDTNGDNELSKDEALAAKSINCSGLGIYSLEGIENFTNLTSLKCNNNNLSSLPISELTALQVLDCSGNQLWSIDISDLWRLTSLECQHNQLTSLDVSHNQELTYIDCQDNSLSVLTVRRNLKLETLHCEDNKPGFKVFKSSSQMSLKIFISSDGSVEISDVVGVPIADPIFADYLISNFDKDGDGSIDAGELAAITNIDCSGLNITSLTGIKYITNLQTLNCSYNKLTSLDVLGMSNLKSIICGGNKLSALDLSNMTLLRDITCFDNGMSSINVTGCTLLELMYCPGNLFTTLDVTGNTALKMLDCTENPNLTTVYLSKDHHNANTVLKDDHTKLEFQ